MMPQCGVDETRGAVIHAHTPTRRGHSKQARTHSRNIVQSNNPNVRKIRLGDGLFLNIGEKSFPAIINFYAR